MIRFTVSNQHNRQQARNAVSLLRQCRQTHSEVTITTAQGAVTGWIDSVILYCVIIETTEARRIDEDREFIVVPIPHINSLSYQLTRIFDMSPEVQD